METLMMICTLTMVPVAILAALALIRDARDARRRSRDYRKGRDDACREALGFGLPCHGTPRSEAWLRGYEDEMWALSCMDRR